MKHKFHFDKRTGTMIPDGDAVAGAVKPDASNDVVVLKADESAQKPVFEDDRAAVRQTRNEPAVTMRRTDRVTPIQLVGDDGFLESYLDSDTQGITMFRDMVDYDICQITDDQTGKVLGYIGGYALQINFNMSELRTMEKIEECVQGIAKLFRHKIMTQALGEEKR